MSRMIERGTRFQLAQNRSTIAPIIRAISIRRGAFSSRDIVGCEHRGSPLSGVCPTAILNTELLWEEHRAAHPDGHGYSRFCEVYRTWEGRLSPTMRQTHVAGERLFVDYAGTTLEVIDGTTGEVIAAQLFVATLGASSYTYAEATFTQGLADWIGSHTRAFAFFGGVSAMVGSDNLKSGITKACFYEPAVNRSYAEMAAHYDTAIVPARPKKPRDKAKVEAAEHLDRAGRDPCPHRLAQQWVWHRVVVLLDLDVVVEPGAALLPCSIGVRLGRQRLQRRSFQVIEQRPPARPQMP